MQKQLYGMKSTVNNGVHHTNRLASIPECPEWNKVKQTIRPQEDKHLTLDEKMLIRAAILANEQLEKLEAIDLKLAELSISGQPLTEEER